MVTNFWYDSADAISAQLEAARDGLVPAGTVQTNNLAGDGRFGGWVQVVARQCRTATRRRPSTCRHTTVFNTSYEQDYLGRAGRPRLSERRHHPRRHLRLRQVRRRVRRQPSTASRSRATMWAPMRRSSRAASSSTRSPRSTGSNVDATPGAGLLAEFDATAWGLRGNAGYRFNSGNVFVEPAVSLSWVNANIDDYTVGGATVAFDDIQSFRGSRRDSASAARSARASGDLVAFRRRFTRSTNSRATTGATTSPSARRSRSSRTRPAPSASSPAGLNYSTGTARGLRRGEVDFGGERDGLSGRAGVRLRF